MEMNCRAFIDQLDALVDGDVDGAISAACRAHAATCAACRTRLDDTMRLRAALRALPVPPASPGFVTRVLAAARATQPSPRPAYQPAPWTLALAASLVVAIGVAAVIVGQRERGAPAPQEPEVVALAPNQVVPVKLVFRSPQARSGVTIHLHLPEGVELAGHPGRRDLRWQTDLQAGANLLELPVIVQPDARGVLTAALSYGQDRRQFAILVQARRPSALMHSPPQHTAAANVLPAATQEVDHV